MPAALRPRLGGLACALAVVAALMVGCGTASQSPRLSGAPIKVFSAPDRAAAPTLRGDLLDGGGFDASEHSGHVIVVNFWASWCAPCVAEATDLEQAYQATKAQGVVFVGVNVRDEKDKARGFVRGRLTYPSIFDPASQAALGFAVTPTTIPATIVIDRSGRIAAVCYGAVLASKLRPVLDALLAEPTPTTAAMAARISARVVAGG